MTAEAELRRQRHRLAFLLGRLKDAESYTAWTTTAWLSFKNYGDDEEAGGDLTSAKIERQLVNLAAVLEELDEAMSRMHGEVLNAMDEAGIEAGTFPRVYTLDPRDEEATR